ncbi:universal stress protein [Microbacterium sp. 5K110]|jgi:nucleotide-binding universal stress UspA family protein|uniref:universal stress protein n=1 Tax=unclassified Microbacterium TaxID=2609290 RepID=UPI0010FF0C0C|nr:universal stress protein [Microbacterium sp. 5K110]TLF30844.1 universal stress protein [Microbacterium sp. 5K110]
MAESTPDRTRVGAVIAGVVPGQSPRVIRAAARQAALAGTELVVVHVDTTRFVAFEDPDGYVNPSTLDVVGAAARAALAEVQSDAASALDGDPVPWSVRQVIGDPALALIHLADEIDASLLVVGTRKRGLGESLREFLTGSVAARLTHRQHRPVLVVPLGEPLAPDEELVWE